MFQKQQCKTNNYVCAQAYMVQTEKAVARYKPNYYELWLQYRELGGNKEIFWSQIDTLIISPPFA